MSYYPEPYSHSRQEIKVKLNLSNYATKYDIKKKQVLIHKIAWKTDLDKLEVDQLDIVKLKIFPVDLSKLSTVAKNNAVTKIV